MIWRPEWKNMLADLRRRKAAADASQIGHDLAMVNVQKRRDEQAEMRDKIHQNCREMCIKHGMQIPERLRSK